MPRKLPSKRVGEARMPVPTYATQQLQTAEHRAWIADYSTRVAAKNALAKTRKKETE